jgi:hypothetical protein
MDNAATIAIVGLLGMMGALATVLVGNTSAGESALGSSTRSGSDSNTGTTRALPTTDSRHVSGAVKTS